MALSQRIDQHPRREQTLERIIHIDGQRHPIAEIEHGGEEQKFSYGGRPGLRAEETAFDDE